jgi:dTDP-4-amino-4,6-dideoxygalactose transaminase
MKIQQIPPTKPYFPNEDIQKIKSDVEKILRSGMLTLGEYTKRFEAEFAKLCKTKYAVAVNSGTSALEITLRAANIKGGDEVLVPTNTFSASVASVIFAGGKPVLTDVNAESLCIDAANTQKNLTKKTKAIMAVHVGGLVCPDIKALKELCEDHHLTLIEDAAHAQGSAIDKQMAGSLGDAGCFSFYPTKVITTGEGGIVTTDNENIAKQAMILRDQGKENFSSNIIVKLGYNWRMSEINAAIGLTQIQRLPAFIKQRNKIARFYDQKLSKTKELKPVKTPPKFLNNYYKYTAILSSRISRDDFKQKLREKGVKPGGEVYWPPLHMEPIYQNLLGVKEGDFPVAEDVCRRMICLPMYSQMTMTEAEYVINKVNEVLRAL